MFFFKRNLPKMGVAVSNSSKGGGTPDAAATEGHVERKRLLGRLLALQYFSIHGRNASKANRFIVGDLIGYGSFGEVSDCVDAQTGVHYAVKIIKQGSRLRGKNTTRRRFKREVEILSMLNHRNIVKLHDSFEDKKYFYCVLGKCEGLSLASYIIKRKHLDENTAAGLCKQILEALSYLHSLNIMHRDVKAENFMFESADEDAPLILLDFGISLVVPPSALVTNICGSLHYVSPEILRRSYSFPADMWALGVLVFVMLFGRYPFIGSSTFHTCRSILQGTINYTDSPIVISDLGIDFIASLLEMDQQKRLTAEQALQHKWITGKGGETCETSAEDDYCKTTDSVLLTESGTQEKKQYPRYQQCST